MIYLLIILGAILGFFICVLLQKKQKQTIERNLQILSVLLLVVYSIRFFFDDAIDNTFNLFYVDIITPVDAATTWIFSRGGSIAILILRWATLTVIGWGVISSFFKHRFLKWMMSILGIFIGFLNLIFFQANLIAYFGNIEFSAFSIRGIQFASVVIVLLILSFMNLRYVIQNNMVITRRDITNTVSIFFISSLAVMPQTLLYNFFGNYGESPLDFVNSHLFLILLPFIIMIASYFIMFSKRQEDRDIMLVFLVLAGYFQYFYLRRTGIGSMPLHLCNTAIILMLFAYVFKLKGLFYFNYFANVLGALLAMLLPNYSSDLFSMSVVHYWYNHLYAFFIPILGVAFHTFERPTLKLMLKAIGVFTLYYIIVLFLNSWLNNYASVDYFFTYSDFITSKINAERIQYMNVISFEYRNLTFIFYWLYQIILYLGFIFLMFMSWYVYDGIFQFADRYYNLYLKRKKMNLDILELRRLLNGRDLSSPIHPGGVDMIKITHFTKKYGTSNKKAVDDFSLEVHAGEVFGFLGHNGAGKSTTIKSLVGIQSISEGEMEICGYSIKTQPLEAKLNIGYVSDNHAVYEKLTGREFINYVGDLYKVPKEVREERLIRYSERFSLAFAMDNEIKSYSHGMKQKLIVIASLIHEPKVWILDEPLTGLDPTSAYQIKECMREHANKGNIVFFSSHVIEVVEKICDRIAIIGQGKLEGVYIVKDLLEQGVSLEQLYMDSVQNHSPVGAK